MLMNKTAIECWNILKYEIESIIDTFVLLKNKENGPERNTCQKKLLEKYCLSKLCGGFIYVLERTKTVQITKMHLTWLQLKLENLKEPLKT